MSTVPLKKKCKFRYALSIVNNMIFAIADIHWYFSSKAINFCAKHFAPIKMFLIHSGALQPSRCMSFAQ